MAHDGAAAGAFRRRGVFAFALLSVAASAFGHDEKPGEPVKPKLAKSAAYDTRVEALSLRDCIRMAVLRNADVQVERYNPEITDAELQSLYGDFDVVSFAESHYRKAKQDTQQTGSGLNFFLSFLNLNNAVIIHEDTYKLGFRKKWDLGTETEISYFVRRNKTVSGTSAAPLYTGEFQWKFRQPLLSGFGQKATLAKTRRTEADLAASEHALTDLVSRTVGDVEQAYWDLVFAIRDRDSRREVVELAHEILHFNEKKVADGLAEPIIVIQAQASEAQFQDGFIQAQYRVKAAEDALRKLIEHTDNPNYWTYSIEPTDTPVVYSEVPELSNVLGHVFEQRWDFQKLLKEIEGMRATVAGAGNATLPKFDFVWSYSRTNFDRNLSLAMYDSIYEKYDDWDVGFVLEYPLGNNAALGRERRAKLEVLQAQTRLKGLERRIMKDVTEGVRDVRSGLERVDATRKAVDLGRKKLEAEREKYNLGLASGQFVLEYQKDLSVSLQDETTSLRDYNKAWARLRRAMGINLQGLEDVVRAARQTPDDARGE